MVAAGADEAIPMTTGTFCHLLYFAFPPEKLGSLRGFPSPEGYSSLSRRWRGALVWPPEARIECGPRLARDQGLVPACIFPLEAIVVATHQGPEAGPSLASVQVPWAASGLWLVLGENPVRRQAR
jgi:hypothetical protein